MKSAFSFSQFKNHFPDDDSCLDEIKRMRFPMGSTCPKCGKQTIYYKLKNRTAYSCEFCRHQIFPLAGTIFEKSTTPLRLWFYAMFVMTQTKSGISIRQLQRELDVTYKTAWRIYGRTHKLMKQNNGDLLKGTIEIDEVGTDMEKKKVFRWTLFNTFVISVVHKNVSGQSNKSEKKY